MSLEFQDTPADPRRCPRCKRLISTPCTSRVDGEVAICRDCDNLEVLVLELWPERPLPDINECLARNCKHGFNPLGGPGLWCPACDKEMKDKAAHPPLWRRVMAGLLGVR